MYGKRILLGITGGIAAYKIAYLIRSLKRQEAEVKCIMTPASSSFISPLVVSTLSKITTETDNKIATNNTTSKSLPLGVSASKII